MRMVTGGEPVDVQQVADGLVARLERLPFTRFHLKVGLLLGVGTFFDAYDSLAIAVALTAIFATLHISFLYTGILISIAYLGQFVGAISAGLAAEGLGRKRVFAVALLLFGLASIAASFATSYQQLFWARLIQGFGLGAEVPIAGALFNEYVQGRSRGKIVMIYESAFSWGLFAAPLIGSVLFASAGPASGWRYLFLIGGIPFLWAIVAWFLLPESARWLVDKGRLGEAETLVDRAEATARRAGLTLPSPRPVARADVRRTDLGELFAPQYRRRTVLTWVQWFMCYFITYGYATWLPSIYVRIGHLSPQFGVLLTALGTLVLMPFIYLTAFLLDVVGRKPVFTIGFALAAAGALLGVLLVGVLHRTGWPTLFVSAEIMGLGANLNSNGVYTYTPELFPTRMRAWATSVASSMNRIASFLSPILVGALLAARMGVGSVFGMFAIAGVLGMLGLLFLGVETKRRTLEEIAS